MAELSLYLLQTLLLPDVFSYIVETLYFLFVRHAPGLEQGRRSDSSCTASNASSPTGSPPEGDAPSFCPSQEPGNLQPGLQHPLIHASPERVMDESTNPLPSQSVVLTSHDEPSNYLVAHGQRHSLTLPPTHPPQIKSSDQPQHHKSATVPQKSTPTTSPSPVLSPQPTPSPESQNMFSNAQGFTVSGGTFINSVDNSTTILNTSNNFMKGLLDQTIPGAAFDSSARDPPPRCHPGTRLAILERCIDFIISCIGARKIRWVVGAAGVGKSAIMQSVAESALPLVVCQASIFFFVKGRSDGSKAIVTLAYQIAAKSELYRQLIEYEISRDPSLLLASLPVQFKKFIIDPFINNLQLNSGGRVLIIIDGLDECNKSQTQRELLQLISDFCLTYPSSPIVWMIASRPEPHITSFFAQDNVEAAYEKEEVLVDSDEARADVESFLRVELSKIQVEFLLNPRSQWPSEHEFWKLALASGGLFVYAHTVIKYIGDPDIGNPTLQLNDVLKVIDAHPLPDVPREQHPMAHLDALYAQILSKVPHRIMVNTRKLLLALVSGWVDEFEGEFEEEESGFILLCNWFGMTSDDAYAAIRHLRSVLTAPGRERAHLEQLKFFHKSFIDYLSDFSRSGFFPDLRSEAHQLKVQCTFRILEQAPSSIDFGDADYYVSTCGTLARGSGSGDNISLTWPVDEGFDWDDNETRLDMYKTAIANVARGIGQGEATFCTEFCIRLITTHFESFNHYHAFRQLHDFVFDESRHGDFMQRGILKQVPVKVLNFSDIGASWEVKLQFRNLTGITGKDEWNPSCAPKHEREGEWGEGKGQEWTTEFSMEGDRFAPPCDFCCRRLESQLENLAKLPNQFVSVLFTSTGTCFVELRFVDLEGGESEWMYRFVHSFKEGVRKVLGSDV